MITTTSSIPPMIREFFKFEEDEEDILSILNYLKEAKWHKLDKCPRKKAECEKLYKEILEIYESIKKKKEDPEREKDNETQRFMYSFRYAKRSSRELLFGLKYKALRFFRSKTTSEIHGA